MRILEAMEFKNKEALEETLLWVEFYKKLPIVLTEKMIQLLDLGLFYKMKILDIKYIKSHLRDFEPSIV